MLVTILDEQQRGYSLGASDYISKPVDRDRLTSVIARYCRPETSGNVLLIDDYGHHTTEIEATLAAAKSGWPKRRVVLVFQPHRYTRTRDLIDDFAQVLSAADVLILLDVYAAGEAPIAGADGRAIARAVRSRGVLEPVFVDNLDELEPVLKGLVADGDIVLTMGAGDIGAYAAGLPKRLSKKPTLKVHS